LASSQLPIPNAVSLSMVDRWVNEWTTPVQGEAREATDFEWLWPDGATQWRRPTMEWEARCTGTWPTQASSSIWSDYLFTTIESLVAPTPLDALPEIGCDVARMGDDRTAVHTRWGNVSLHHESRQGLRTTETTGWLVETVRQLAGLVNEVRAQRRCGKPALDEREIPIKVDDDGIGGSCVDQLMERGYNVIAVGAGSSAINQLRYPNKRSELWFTTRDRAIAGGVALSRIDREERKKLKLQALAPTWKLDSIGRRVVEPKAETKKRLGRSCDDMDAMNLAYYEAGSDVPSSEEIPVFDHPHLGPPSAEERFRRPETARRRSILG
jgi:hypothetical protein